jgi:hypothetical protein
VSQKQSSEQNSGHQKVGELESYISLSDSIHPCVANIYIYICVFKNKKVVLVFTVWKHPRGFVCFSIYIVVSNYFMRHIH